MGVRAPIVASLLLMAAVGGGQPVPEYRITRHGACATSNRRSRLAPELAPFGYSFTCGITWRVAQTSVTPDRFSGSLSTGEGGKQNLYVHSWVFVGCSRCIPARSGARQAGRASGLSLRNRDWHVIRAWLLVARLRQA
jgi:hypothetical protein